MFLRRAPPKVVPMLGQLLQPELEEMIREGRFVDLRELIAEITVPDAAELIDELPPQDMAIVFRILPRPMALEIYEYLPLEAQESLIRALGQEDVAALLNGMNPDDRTALLEELPGEVTRRLLTLLSPAERAVAQKLLGYPEGSIGRRMTPDYLAIDAEWTMEHVLEYIRTHGHDSETLNLLYVVDERGRLVDEIRLREVLLSPRDRKVSELMLRQAEVLRATDPQEAAVQAFRKYDRIALPVTDSGGILVGILTVDDVLDVAEEEATEDIQKLGGMEALEDPYMDTPLPVMIKKRASWLIVLFMGEMLTASAMGFFEHELAKALVLMLFVPLIISSGGNSGSQAASLVIRALALGEVTVRDWWRVMRREVLSGLALGSILGIVGFLRIAIGAQFSDVYTEHWAMLGATIGITLVGVVLWGTLTGSLIPLLMKRIGVDPAAASAPFVATLVDVTGLIIYFSVASVVLSGTLLAN